jgi:predicted nucleic acid-binding protein
VTVRTASEAIVVDSSGWLEYFTNDSKADLFAPYLEGEQPVLLPTVVIYEVRKILILNHGRTLADAFYSDALRRTVVSFDEVLAARSAELSVSYKLAMADAIIYATATHLEAKLITSDSHFADLPGVLLL